MEMTRPASHGLALEGAGRRTLQETFDAARTQIERLTPTEALAATRRDVLLIDIRSSEDRERDGIIPGSIHIPRTVLEWRVDPASAWRNPHVGSLDEPVLLLCAEGYSSVLAAAAMVELGFARAGDLIGGFAAWQEARLPITPAPTGRIRPGELVGMQGPDH
jgi:rhodanese-related sulfurtransferase